MIEKTTNTTAEDKQMEVAPSSSGVTLDDLVDEHEELVSVDGRSERRKGIFLLPNLFTTGALFGGFYSIIASIDGRFEAASIAIVFAMIFDILDGRVARLTNTSSKFGAEYDSLSDMVSFGLAPALLMFNWTLGELGKLGWGVSFVYVACTALRLAKFNTQSFDSSKTKAYFNGLASPAAAGIIASFVWVCHDLGLTSSVLPREIATVVAVFTGILGVMMVVNLPYYSFKDIDFRGRVPFAVIFLVVLIFGLVAVDPPKIFLLTGLTYFFSGPLIQVWRACRINRTSE